MTQRKISFALKKINESKQQQNFTEALVRNYHLNLELLKYIFSYCCATKSEHNKKISILISQLVNELDVKPQFKGVITKKSLKTIMPWALKMEAYYKFLKHKQPSNTKLLLNDGEHILAILNISANKIITA